MYNDRIPVLSVYVLAFHIRFYLEKGCAMGFSEKSWCIFTVKNVVTFPTTQYLKILKIIWLWALIYVEILLPLLAFEDLKVKLLKEMVEITFPQMKGNHDNYNH